MNTGFFKPTVEGMNKGTRSELAFRHRSAKDIGAVNQLCTDSPVHGSRGRRNAKSAERAHDMAGELRDWRLSGLEPTWAN